MSSWYINVNVLDIPLVRMGHFDGNEPNQRLADNSDSGVTDLIGEMRRDEASLLERLLAEPGPLDRLGK